MNNIPNSDKLIQIEQALQEIRQYGSKAYFDKMRPTGRVIEGTTENPAELTPAYFDNLEAQQLRKFREEKTNETDK